MTDFTKTIRSFRSWTSLLDTILANDFFRYFYIIDRNGTKVGRVFLSNVNRGFIMFGMFAEEQEMSAKEMFNAIKERCGASFSILPLLNETGLFRVTC